MPRKAACLAGERESLVCHMCLHFLLDLKVKIAYLNKERSTCTYFYLHTGHRYPPLDIIWV